MNTKNDDCVVEAKSSPRMQSTKEMELQPV